MGRGVELTDRGEDEISFHSHNCHGDNWTSIPEHYRAVALLLPFIPAPLSGSKEIPCCPLYFKMISQSYNDTALSTQGRAFFSFLYK